MFSECHEDVVVFFVCVYTLFVTKILLCVKFVLILFKIKHHKRYISDTIVSSFDGFYFYFIFCLFLFPEKDLHHNLPHSSSHHINYNIVSHIVKSI